jgi:hypothetical protein
MAKEPAPFGKLSWQDWKKGLITAALVGGLSVIFPALSVGVLTMATLKAAGIGAATGLAAYILKNLATNSEDEFLKKEPK